MANNQRMDKMAGNKGSNSATRKQAMQGNRDTIYGAEYTQNLSEESVSLSKLRSADSLSMNVPGQGNVARAVGEAREGSARKYADAMDSVTGSPDVEREASSGNN
jgi:hypothetical protein